MRKRMKDRYYPRENRERSMPGNDPFEKILLMVQESSRTVRNLYIFYLAAALFFSATIESVTHRQLLIATEGIVLPVIGVKLPLLGFFVVGPMLLLALHIYFLIHAFKYAGQLALVRTRQGDSDNDHWKEHLHGSLFTWFFLEKEEEAALTFSVLIRMLIFLSFWCIVPVVLLRFQWIFLPYHQPAITWMHRGLLGISLIINLYFYARIYKLKHRAGFKHWFLEFFKKYLPPVSFTPLNNSESLKLRWMWHLDCLWVGFRQAGAAFWDTVGVLVVAISLYYLPMFSFSILTIPETKEENERCFSKWDWPAVKANDLANWNQERNFGSGCENGQFNLRINQAIDRNLDLSEQKLALQPEGVIKAARFINQLDLLNQDAVDPGPRQENKQKTRIDLLEKIEEQYLEEYQTLDLKGRNLTFAILWQSDLRKADLRNADLFGADLFRANLKRANLQGAELQFADLLGADLFGAKNLSCDQISSVASLNSITQFPDYLEVEITGKNKWTCKEKKKDKNLDEN